MIDYQCERRFILKNDRILSLLHLSVPLDIFQTAFNRTFLCHGPVSCKTTFSRTGLQGVADKHYEKNATTGMKTSLKFSRHHNAESVGALSLFLCNDTVPSGGNGRQRLNCHDKPVLYVGLLLNAAFFFLEVVGSSSFSSVRLLPFAKKLPEDACYLLIFAGLYQRIT